MTYYLGIHTYPVGSEIEFGFCFIAVDNISGKENFTYRSTLATQIIPRQDRESVSFLLKYYTRELIQHASHHAFFMETFELNIPDKALEKYKALCHIFQSIGYSVTATPTAPGKYKWTMSL